MLSDTRTMLIIGSSIGLVVSISLMIGLFLLTRRRRPAGEVEDRMKRLLVEPQPVAKLEESEALLHL